jgi:hypothetical protein
MRKICDTLFAAIETQAQVCVSKLNRSKQNKPALGPAYFVSARGKSTVQFTASDNLLPGLNLAIFLAGI